MAKDRLSRTTASFCCRCERPFGPAVPHLVFRAIITRVDDDLLLDDVTEHVCPGCVGTAAAGMVVDA